MDSQLIQKLEANLAGKIPDSAFTDEEITELYTLTLNAVVNKLAQHNSLAFQIHETIQ